jgi:GntR family transcriptional regulator
VAKACKLLERDAVIETKGYRGTCIHPKAWANCRFDLQDWILRKLGEAIHDLGEAGVTDAEIRNAFAPTMNRRTAEQ